MRLASQHKQKIGAQGAMVYKTDTTADLTGEHTGAGT